MLGREHACKQCGRTVQVMPADLAHYTRRTGGEVYCTSCGRRRIQRELREADARALRSSQAARFRISRPH